MRDKSTALLLIEADPAESARLRAALATGPGGQFQVELATRLDEALILLARREFEVVLLDLAMPDGEGVEAFERVIRVAPKALVLVLGSASDEEAARQVVQRGAEDFFVRSHADVQWLPRALGYIMERKATREALFEEKERAQVTLNSIGDAVLTTNLAGNVTYLNGVAEAMTGWLMSEALGRPLAEVFSIINRETREVAENPAQHAIARNQTVGLAADSLLVRRDGYESAIEDSSAPIHNRDGSVAGAVIVFHDVSESREMARKMAHLAQHDSLTGLPNRLLLAERLSQAIGQACRHKKQVGVLFVDLDDFKKINDSLGHAMGDELLCSVARRLSACVRTTDTVCRQGGDEFVILLAEIEQQQDAAQIAKKLLASAAPPHLIDRKAVHVTLSIGISVYPDDGDNAERTMQNADTAMYYAKAKGRNNYQFYTPDMQLRKVQGDAFQGM